MPATQRTSAVDIITYRLNNQMTYVTPAQDYQEAVNVAREVFRDELGGVDEKRISFSVNVLTDGQTRSVRISSFAWPAIVSHLTRYEIIDVHVQPEIIVESDFSDTPPEYPFLDSKESSAFYTPSHSCTHSKPQSPCSVKSTGRLSPKRLFRRLV
ncbi:hypothetical protein BV22DRAFT_1039022 [Leucogyrophana mollusca]|uniref:Uncharacterized protein n=1 Tax=Leucogyrophana mollusca TaxID=85980 RepID=A0ACB8B607_9AGAM|nr:hypothetical protein BV22DRAFT_1039022 [Leucogyrophana mollusca]